MTEVFQELIKQAPYIAAVVITIGLFLWSNQRNEDKRLAHDAQMEVTRAANAKEREQERRTYEIQINSMWASNIKSIVDQISVGNDKIVNALLEHEKASKERYEKMGITSDLLDAAKEQLRK